MCPAHQIHRNRAAGCLLNNIQHACACLSRCRGAAAAMRRGATRAATGRRARPVIGRTSARSMGTGLRASPRPSCSTEPLRWTLLRLFSLAVPPGRLLHERAATGKRAILAAGRACARSKATAPRAHRPSCCTDRASLLSQGIPSACICCGHGPCAEWRRRDVDCPAYLARCMWSALRRFSMQHRTEKPELVKQPAVQPSVQMAQIMVQPISGTAGLMAEAAMLSVSADCTPK